MTRESLTGWGRTSSSMADLVTPTSEADILTHFATADAVIARGLGRSYGDAAQLAGGIVLNNRSLSGISNIDPVTGVVTVGAGVSIDELLNVAIPKGWFVPVTPGTRQVTLGGAIASDVHGKNHHVDGSIGHHVTAMRLVTPTGARTITPDLEPELFWATIGGMGLTGVVTEVTLRMIPIETDHVMVDTDRFGDLDAVMAAMASGDDRYRYSVAWVDCMTKGRSMGRAILTRGDHALREQVDAISLDAPRAPRLAVPFDPPSGLLNTLTIRAFNELWFRSAPAHREGEPQSLSSFFHPLDGVRGWNRCYGPRGFVQYQFAVPDAESDTVRRAIERLSSSGVPNFIGVLKRFGPANPGPLSFPIAGWTLAVDLPVGPSALPDVLDSLDDMVLDAGGRVYLSKDSRLEPATAAAMYPRLAEFNRIKRSVDPHGVLTSDLVRRLALTKK